MLGVVSGVSSEGVGIVWLLVPPSRSIYPFRPCGSVRFPRIRLKPDNVRRFCQLVSSLASLVSVRPRSSPFVVRWRRGVSFSFSSRSSSRLARLVGRLVSILCGSPVVSSYSSIRLAFRCLVSPCDPYSSSRCFVSFSVSSVRLVKQLAFSRFARRSVARLVVSGRVLASRSFLFLFYLARCVSWPWGRATARLTPCLVAACLFPCLSSVIVGRGDSGIGVPLDDTRDAPFYSARFPIRQ